MANVYTFEEVKEILSAVQMFSNSNNNQGLQSIKGQTFGERSEHIIQSYDKANGSIYQTSQILKGE